MTKSMIFAYWLYMHPFSVCFDDGVAYWYNSIAEKFFYHNPKNKVQTGNYEAKALKFYLAQFLEWADVISCL